MNDNKIKMRFSEVNKDERSSLFFEILGNYDLTPSEISFLINVSRSTTDRWILKNKGEIDKKDEIKYCPSYCNLVTLLYKLSLMFPDDEFVKEKLAALANV